MKNSLLYKTVKADADGNITIHYTYNGFYLSNRKGVIGAPYELIKDEQARKLVMLQGQSLMNGYKG